MSEKININQSYYTNISYWYKSRYIVTGSARRDESNIFGVKTNQKGVPLWSIGLAWIINKESFYDTNWLPLLKLRATYGYNGNVDKSVSAYLTALTGIQNIYGTQTATIQNPPNPSLRWEKVKTWNFGLDFTFKDNRLSGNIDFYQKNSIDLIGNNLIPFQSGVSQFRGNGASLQTKGVDLIINSNNFINDFTWITSLLFNYNADKVTSYKVKQSSNSNIVNTNVQNPLEGYPYSSIFSFPYAGLDATGVAQGYLDGVISKDYAKIFSTLDPSQIKYHGSATPKYFGSIINTMGYRSFEFSFNVVYKFDYYFRRTNVFSGSNYGSAASTTFELGDYEKRWKSAGDELITKIPALVYPANSLQDSFFQSSEVMVEKGDNIRLQDIRLSYSLSKKSLSKLPFKKASFFIYSRNLGILWRANSLKIDPDYGNTIIPQSFSCSAGINLTL